ncbi:MAG: hypothetical protein K2K63_08225 [Acetatifactor sp.]|nr:hypothetical protein [Acetatifactor sp.]
MNALLQNLGSSITGNIPKAILCVRQYTYGDSLEDTAKAAGSLQTNLLAGARKALEGTQTFSSLTEKGGVMGGSGYLAMEVQYNPSSIHMETQAGQVEYLGGNLGGKSDNQIVQDTQPVSTTMRFQLIFDDMNPFDAFMLENLVPTTVGNTVSLIGSEVRKKEKERYSVQDQVEGLMALLTQVETRQVIFFWAKMCFRGELTGVNARYTMFNKDGNPIRGVVDLTIRQGDEEELAYDTKYWDQAFTETFGQAAENTKRGMAGAFSKVTNNNFLNLNL